MQLDILCTRSLLLTECVLLLPGEEKPAETEEVKLNESEDETKKLVVTDPAGVGCHSTDIVWSLIRTVDGY